MANPKFARTNMSGARLYVDPTDSHRRYPSVTTILNAVAKPALPRWAAKEAATYAVANLAELASVSPAVAIAQIKAAPWEKRDKAATLGSAVHDYAEAWQTGADMPPWPDDVAPFMASYALWLEDFTPTFEMVEATVANPSFGYAGTLDAVVTITVRDQIRRILVDYKTGKGVYSEAALQLTAYRYAEEVWLPNATKIKLADATDGPIHGAAVLHLAADGYEFLPVDTSPAVFERFLAALSLHRWTVNEAPDVIKSPLWPVAKVSA